MFRGDSFYRKSGAMFSIILLSFMLSTISVVPFVGADGDGDGEEPPGEDEIAPMCSVDFLEHKVSGKEYFLDETFYISEEGKFFINGFAEDEESAVVNVQYNRDSPDDTDHDFTDADAVDGEFNELEEYWRSGPNDDGFVDGEHEICCRAIDFEGNGEETDGFCQEFCVDTEGPEEVEGLTHDNPSECVANYINKAPEWTWDATGDNGCAGISHYEVELYFSNGTFIDNFEIGNVEFPSFEVPEEHLENGDDYYVIVWAVDNAGNSGPESDESEHVVYDVEDPEVEITGPDAGLWYNVDFSVSETDEDNLGVWKCEYRITNDGETTLDWTVTECEEDISINIGEFCPVDGLNNCKVWKRATDNACNTDTTHKQFDLDRVAPVTIKTVGEPKYPGEGTNLALNFEALEALGLGHYEVWAIFGEDKISLGKFNIGDDTTFFSKLDLTTADSIVVTIEPEGNIDDIPSGIVVLTGEVDGSSVELNFPVDLGDVEGNYILATPTNGDDTDETSGIWFLNTDGPVAGLALPVLPEGWKYEGWVVNQGSPLTSGRFSMPNGFDEFDGFSGPELGPPFPGEDFLENEPDGIVFPAELADGLSLAVVSVEPDLEGVDPTGDGPFSIKPLVAEIPFGAADHFDYGMDSNLGSVPMGDGVITEGGLDWFVTDETEITLECDDGEEGDVSGCGATFYRIMFEDEGFPDFTEYEGPFTLGEEDGFYTLEYYSEDSVDVDGSNIEGIHSELDKLDNIAPETTKTIDGPQYVDEEGNVWVSGETEFTLTCEDEEVGCDLTCYDVQIGSSSGGVCNEAPITFTLGGYPDGEFEIFYWSFDLLGNIEEENSQIDFVDSSAPEIVVLNPTEGEAEDVQMCVQSVVAIVTDEESGVNHVWAELLDEEGEVVRTEDMVLTAAQGVYEALMNKELPAGDYTLVIYAEDNVGNVEVVEIEESLAEDIFVEFLTDGEGGPANCEFNINDGGSCDFTLHVCMRGADSTSMWLDKLGGVITPFMMNATISKEENSAYVGLLSEPLTEAGLLDLGEGIINGRTTFDLNLNISPEDAQVIGPGDHNLDYLLQSFIAEEEDGEE